MSILSIFERNYGAYPKDMFDGMILGDVSEQQNAYWDILHRYQKAKEYIKKQEDRFGRGHSEIGECSWALNKLHNQLKELGHALHKSEKEVFADILDRSKNLDNYELPEFTIISRENLNLNRLYSLEDEEEQDLDPVEHEYYGEKHEAFVHDLKKGEVAILFAKKISAAVREPDNNIMTTRGNLVSMQTKGEKERFRRAIRLARKLNAKILDYYEFAHEYTERIIGIVVDQDSIESVAQMIRQNREEFGIREEDMPSEIIEREWADYQAAIDLKLKGHSLSEESARIIFDDQWRRIHEPDYEPSSAHELRNKLLLTKEVNWVGDEAEEKDGWEESEKKRNKRSRR